MKRSSGKQITTVSTALFLLAVLSLACGIRVVDDEAGPSNQDQTLQVLGQTQTAVSGLSSTLFPPTSVTNEPAAPAETTAPPDTSSIAQPDIQFNGISFSYDKSLAGSVSQVIVPGQSYGDSAMPGDTFPSYTEFTFNNYPLTGSLHEPAIRIYPVAEYEEISQAAADTFEEMRIALRNKAVPEHNGYLPFVPFWNAAMIFNAQYDYLTFQNGEGMRYLTMFAQASYPPDNRNVFYTFQGMTNDGKYYVSAIFPVSSSELPDNGDSVITDYMVFEQNWPNYLLETVQKLNNLGPGEFYPSLTIFDEIITSVTINP